MAITIGKRGCLGRRHFVVFWCCQAGRRPGGQGELTSMELSQHALYMELSRLMNRRQGPKREAHGSAHAARKLDLRIAGC